MRLIVLIFSLLLSFSASALEGKLTLQQSWGLLIGDRIQATIDLPVNTSELDLHSLPEHDKRHGPWLMMHDLTLKDKQIELNMQLINVPAENRQVMTPEFKLRTKKGDFIDVAPVALQIGSFLQNKDGQSVFALRNDANIPLDDHASLYWQLWVAVSLLILAGLIWLAWHFGLRPRQRLPFATAMFELNKMRLLGRKDADAASRSLHHAFNRSAGRVVIHSQLDKLWDKCPWLQAEQAEIESFYQLSAAHFFSPAAPQSKDFAQILLLTKACRAREKLA